MHGMLIAAVLILVFILVATATGGSVVWFYRASSPSYGNSRSPKKTSAATGEPMPPGATIPDIKVSEADLASPAGPVAESALEAPAPRPEIQNVERPLLALPPAAEPTGPGSRPDPADDADDAGGAGDAGDEPSGAQIYVLDSSRRPGR